MCDCMIISIVSSDLSQQLLGVYTFSTSILLIHGEGKQANGCLKARAKWKGRPVDFLSVCGSSRRKGKSFACNIKHSLCIIVIAENKCVNRVSALFSVVSSILHVKEWNPFAHLPTTPYPLFTSKSSNAQPLPLLATPTSPISSASDVSSSPLRTAPSSNCMTDRTPQSHSDYPPHP